MVCGSRDFGSSAAAINADILQNITATLGTVAAQMLSVSSRMTSTTLPFVSAPHLCTDESIYDSEPALLHLDDLKRAYQLQHPDCFVIVIPSKVSS